MIIPSLDTPSPLANPIQIILTISSNNQPFQQLLPNTDFLKLCFSLSAIHIHHLHLLSSGEINRTKMLENHALQEDVLPLLQVLQFLSGQERLVDFQHNSCEETYLAFVHIFISTSCIVHCSFVHNVCRM